MKVTHYSEVAAEPAEAPGTKIRWLIDQHDGAPNFAMRVIEVEPGAQTPFHGHGWEHEVFILSGQGTVESAAGPSQLQEGDVVYVAPDEEHCFVNQGEEVFRFICLIPIQE